MPLMFYLNDIRLPLKFDVFAPTESLYSIEKLEKSDRKAFYFEWN